MLEDIKKTLWATADKLRAIAMWLKPLKALEVKNSLN